MRIWFAITKTTSISNYKKCKSMWKLVEIVSNQNLQTVFFKSQSCTLIILENHLIFLNIATTGWPTMTEISKFCPHIYLIFFILSRSNMIKSLKKVIFVWKL